jgi:outer membrane biogenesis lipoprotein LolB
MKRSPALLFVFILSTTICMAGCGLPRPQTDPSLDKAAWQAARDLRSMNREIQTSKGTGKVRLESPGGIQTYQIAWAARAPNRVRITFTASGHPVETIAADGSRVTFLSHTGQHKPHTPAADDPDLEPYTRVPVRLSDLISLLLGQIPVQNFDDAWFVPGDQSRILLRKNFRSYSQELILEPDNTIRLLRLLDREDVVRWEIHYHAFDTMDKKKIPVHMTITNGEHRKAHVTITRFWPNVPVKESVFQLTRTGS